MSKKIDCSLCHKIVSASNYARHRRNAHKVRSCKRCETAPINGLPFLTFSLLVDQIKDRMLEIIVFVNKRPTEISDEDLYHYYHLACIDLEVEHTIVNLYKVCLMRLRCNSSEKII